MSSSLRVALKVICIFIAYLSLIICVSTRITYSLTTADIRRNCMRSEFTLFTQSCDVRQSVDTNRSTKFDVLPVGSKSAYQRLLPVCR